jgi:hypothetical protein
MQQVDQGHIQKQNQEQEDIRPGFQQEANQWDIQEREVQEHIQPHRDILLHRDIQPEAQEHIRPKQDIQPEDNIQPHLDIQLDIKEANNEEVLKMLRSEHPNYAE